MLKNFADVDSPTPGENWVSKPPSERLWEVSQFLKAHEAYSQIEAVDAAENGHIVVAIAQHIPANERGLFLIELESKLKEALDPAVTIWCEPVGDKSKLRALRGVKIETNQG